MITTGTGPTTGTHTHTEVKIPATAEARRSMLLRTCATDGGQKSLLKTRQLLPRLLLCSDWVSGYCVVTEESAFQTLASGKRNGLFDNLCPLIAALINLFSVLKNCRRFMFLSPSERSATVECVEGLRPVGAILARVSIAG